MKSKETKINTSLNLKRKACKNWIKKKKHVKAFSILIMWKKKKKNKTKTKTKKQKTDYPRFKPEAFGILDQSVSADFQTNIKKGTMLGQQLMKTK